MTNRIIDERDETREINGETLPVHVISMELDFPVESVIFEVSEWRSIYGGASRILIPTWPLDPRRTTDFLLGEHLKGYREGKCGYPNQGDPRGLVLRIRSDDQEARATCVTGYKLTMENMILFAPASAVFVS